MKIKIYLLFLLLCTTVNLSSQIKISQDLYQESKTLPKEQIFVHYNTNLILSGENLMFKIYNLNKNTLIPSNLSKIAYLELVDTNKNPVIKRKIALEKGEGYGDIFISSDIKSGKYKLIAYTKWMKNNNSYFEDDILIINPFEEKIALNYEESKNKKITAYNYIYNTRDLVTLNLKELIKDNGIYSISVRKENEGYLNKKSTPQNFNTFSKEISFEEENTIFIPEFRGQLIIGKLTPTSTNKNIKNIKIGISIIGNDKIFKITSTDSKGYFFFNISEPFRSEEVICKLIDEDISSDYKISFPKEKELSLTDLTFTIPKTTQQIIKTINDRSIYTQIQNAYNETIQDSIIPFSTKNSIFKNKTIVYNLDDYTRFNTMKETFVEIINNAWITKKNGKNKFYIRDSETFTNSNIEPLIIIDGYIITDHQELVDIDPKKIQTISLLTEKYKYNSKLYEGIISLNSKKESYIPKNQNNLVNYSIQPISSNKIYFQKEYSLDNKNDRIPDFRTQLLWEPRISTKNNELSFFTSDIKGNFIIEIQGFNNSGKPVNIIKHLHVK
ncbi:hypothetical protein [Tenacibaculum caenipelagi]|uniref:MG2 domain-containing protein n=1 Tax=Tenacibaculum caenipelagi TaxID=1325435 RepID=A0A4R6TG29_9FLAO|nr:hypothetical protein [Tenacibaculum caenipelagi]TDQ27750.1 hypothetical protein DFQ07_1605 [Tenacibaculum caenipelagi]